MAGLTFVSLQGKLNIPSNRVEQLYEAMLPNLPQYVVSLLFIGLEAVGGGGGERGSEHPTFCSPVYFPPTCLPFLCDSRLFVTCLSIAIYYDGMFRIFFLFLAVPLKAGVSLPVISSPTSRRLPAPLISGFPSFFLPALYFSSR